MDCCADTSSKGLLIACPSSLHTKATTESYEAPQLAIFGGHVETRSLMLLDFCFLQTEATQAWAAQLTPPSSSLGKGLFLHTYCLTDMHHFFEHSVALGMEVPKQDDRAGITSRHPYTYHEGRDYLKNVAWDVYL